LTLLCLHSEKIFLSYSPHGLSFTKKEPFSHVENIEQLLLEMIDQAGVLLDEPASTSYCNSKAELCASVGSWEDPNDLYIADDDVIRYVDC